MSVVFSRFWSGASAPQLQTVIDGIQAICAKYEGALYQALIDERGATAIVVFGLPERSHEDDAARALYAAMAIEQLISRLHLAPAVGVATGRVFCVSDVVPPLRQFAIVGPAINLAARLTEVGRPLLCDAQTLQAARW